jgi:hypothetical protein
MLMFIPKLQPSDVTVADRWYNRDRFAAGLSGDGKEVGRLGA